MSTIDVHRESGRVAHGERLTIAIAFAIAIAIAIAFAIAIAIAIAIAFASPRLASLRLHSP